MRFDQAARDMIARLSTSDEYDEKLHALLTRSVEQPAVRAYTADVWHALKTRILADCAADASLIGARSASALRALGSTLQADNTLRARINDWLRVVVADTSVERRDVIAAVVWRVIRGWDAETVARATAGGQSIPALIKRCGSKSAASKVSRWMASGGPAPSHVRAMIPVVPASLIGIVSQQTQQGRLDDPGRLIGCAELFQGIIYMEIDCTLGDTHDFTDFA